MKILHLYYDIMNLYGDYGNVRVLERLIAQSGTDCEVVKKSLGDNVDFNDYGFVFIGSGTEKNQKLVLEDFKRLADGFKAYVEADKPALLTGNSFEMLGKTITDCDGGEHSGLGMFDFTVTEQNKTRMTADAIFECDFLDRPLVGFVNKCSQITGITDHAFTVKRGLADNESDKTEGLKYKNLIGTHLTGPVVVKNPHFAEYLASLLISGEINSECLELAKKGFEVTLAELSKDN